MESCSVQQGALPIIKEDQKKTGSKIPENEPQRSTTPPLPLDCEPLSHQVAGHVHGKGKTKIGMLQYKDGTILKPFQRPSRGQKEAAFYDRVFFPDPGLPSRVFMETLQQFIPCYYGTVAFKEDPTLYYLKLEDVTKKYRKPCIMDVKVGCQTYEDSASQFKKENAKIKYPNMLKVGFQISGMRIYYANSKKYEYYDKSYGRNLGEDTVIEGLKKFFQFEENFQVEALTKILQLLYKLEDWFVHQCLFHFISSSILFVYEGDKPWDSIPELLPKNCISKAEEVFINGLETESTGIPNSWYVDELKPVINRSVIRSDCQTCVNAFHEDCTCDDQNKVQKDVNKKCSNGFTGNVILLERNQTIPSKDLLEPEPPQANNRNPSNGIVQMKERISQNGDKCTESNRSCLANLKMIDFTHVIDKHTQDNNYLFGLRKLISNLEILQGKLN